MAGHISIAIDGPSGSGKSTLARKLAERLGFVYLDTGAIYRAMGLYVHRAGADLDDEQAVDALLPRLQKIRFGHENGTQRVFLGEEDVSEAIRMPEVSVYASQVAAYAAVRAFLLDMQREFAELYDVVMDGRDIGTVVLPHASLKVFLTATPERRAERRYAELRSRGVEEAYEQVLQDIRDRDERDMSRDISPLRQAADAVVLDTTDLDLDESLEALVRLAETRLPLGGERA
ncbi:MAG: (d)CMP kinase [Oscillospiraceae bacterium]|nr:(d)CMP kinase [Oscillospiraceae bacterium]